MKNKFRLVFQRSASDGCCGTFIQTKTTVVETKTVCDQESQYHIVGCEQLGGSNYRIVFLRTMDDSVSTFWTESKTEIVNLPEMFNEKSHFFYVGYEEV